MIPHFLLILSAFLLALGSVLAKGLLSGGFGFDIPALYPLPFLIAQLSGSLCLLASVAVISGKRLRVNAWPLIAPGAILGGGSICTILALHYMTASEASLIFATQPVLVLALAWLFLGEHVTLSVVACITAAVIGVVGIVQSGSDLGSLNRPLGVVFAVMSATGAAIYVVWMRKLSGIAEPVVVLFFVQLVSFVVALAVWIADGLPGADQLELRSVTSAALTGAIYYGAAFLVYLYGLAKVEASRAGIYLSLVPVFTIALAFVWLGELLTLLQFAGGLVVLLAVGCITILTARPTHVRS